MSNQGFTVQAVVTSVRAMVDRGLSIGFHTKEVADEEKLEVFRRQSRSGWLLFKENPIQEEEIPSTVAEVSQKTPSSRLRSVLFIWWQQDGSKGDFEMFYRVNMEKFIEHIKDKLL